MKKLTIAEMKAINKENGFYYFDKDTMDFFGSKVETTPKFLSNGIYLFVTSEKSSFNNDARRFTIRAFNIESGNVNTYSKFLGYQTLKDAKEGVNMACNNAK